MDSLNNEQILWIFCAKYRSGLLVKKKKKRATADLSASSSLTSKISKGSYTSGRSYVSADSCLFCIFSFSHLSYEKRITDRRFSCVVQIDSMCLKMWSKHTVVKYDARASHLTSRFLLCCRDSLIPAYYHSSVFGENEYSDIRHEIIYRSEQQVIR